MAIQLNYTDPETNVEYPASYWVIDELRFIPRAFTSHIKLAGYFDQATHDDSEKRAFTYQEFDLVQNPLVIDITVEDAITGVYTYCLASLPFFVGGEIVA